MITQTNEPFIPCQGTYRFMQYNILAGLPGYGRGVIVEDEHYRKGMIEAIIRGHAPDALVLNEFYDAWAQILPPMLEDAYGFLGMARQDGSTNYNVVAYKKSRFLPVCDGYADVQLATHRHKRAVVWGILEDRETKQRIAVFGTHLDHHGHADLPTRLKQTRLVQDVIASVNVAQLPTVFMGDMNTRPGDVVYQHLQEVTGLQNAMEESGGIDCCFLDDSFRIVCTIVDCGHKTAEASDHKPILIDVVPKEAEDGVV